MNKPTNQGDLTKSCTVITPADISNLEKSTQTFTKRNAYLFRALGKIHTAQTGIHFRKILYGEKST